MRIKVRPNRRKPWAIALNRKVKAWLKHRGHQVVARGADATICIGGDGTIYYANLRHALEGKIIGIGSKTSFVCQLRKENWARRLPALLQGKGTPRATLRARWRGKVWDALADFVIHSQDYRVIWIFLDAGGRHYRFEGDGVIVATATGSSGYAYSAGGPALRAKSKEILIVPICPYRRTFRPLRLKHMKKIRIWSDRETGLILDGRQIGKLKRGEVLTIQQGTPRRFV